MIDLAACAPILATAMIVEGVAFVLIAVLVACDHARLHHLETEVEQGANRQTANHRMGTELDGSDCWRTPFDGRGPVEIGIRQHRRSNGPYAGRN